MKNNAGGGLSMDHLHFLQSSSAVAAIAMIVIGSRWLKRYLLDLI